MSTARVRLKTLYVLAREPIMRTYDIPDSYKPVGEAGNFKNFFFLRVLRRVYIG